MKINPFKIVAFCFGILLLALAVILTIALLFPLLGTSLVSPILQQVFTLYLFYGLSSFVIPLIVLFYAIVLIAPVWNVRLHTIVAGTPLYFFTFVISERLAQFLAERYYNLAGIVYVTSIVLACLLVALEVALAYLFGEKLELTENIPDKIEIVDIIGDEYKATVSIKGSTDKTSTNDEPSVRMYGLNVDSVSQDFQATSTFKTPHDMSDELSKAIAPDLATVSSTEDNNSLLNESTLSSESSTYDENFVKSSYTESEVDTKTAPHTDFEVSHSQSSLLDSLVVLPDTEVEELSSDIAELERVQLDETLVYETQDLSEFEIDDDISSDKKETDFKTDVSIVHSDTSKVEDSEHEKMDSEISDPNLKEVSVLTREEDGESMETSNNDDTSAVTTQFHPAVARPHALTYTYDVPSKLLTEYPGNEYWIIDDACRRDARILKETLREFKIDVEVKGITKGPVVTMFELMPPPGIKLSKITSLQDNIALRLAAPSVRIVAPIPGKEAVGIEVPNASRSIVSMRELIEADVPQLAKMAIPVLLGKDITGRPQTMDIAQTPHLLIAGATGAGKSVCVNSIILSILYNRTPEQVRLLLVDPKIVELKLYNGIAHLLTPVITEPKKAFQALQYCLCEMERRYALLDGLSVRDIKAYNAKVKSEHLAAETLPYIVIIIDEFADLMVTTGKELESTVARLCAMSRAVGIHLVLATQRPSINVITGLIKANIPTRIAFMVASNADSRIILDESGAEKLLGKGDMLYVSTPTPFPVRIQGTFVSDDDVERVVEHVKSLRVPEYIDEEIFFEEDEDTEEVFIGESDPLYDKALDIVLLEGKASASYLQRRLKIGYNRAARIVEEMEERGVVGPANGSKPRDVIGTSR